MPNFVRTRPDWLNLDIPLEAEWDSLDAKTAAALNGDGGGTYAPTPDRIIIGGLGITAHMVENVESMPDVDSTFLPYGTGFGDITGSAIRIPLGVTVRNLTATGAPVTGDQVTIFCDSDSNCSVSVRDAGLTTLFLVGNGDFDDGPWVTLIYVGGNWRVFKSSRGSRLRWQLISASQNFVGPNAVTKGMVLGCGGGGGGAGGQSAAAPYPSYRRGGGGGAGAQLGIAPVALTPNANHPVVIGTGGAGGGVDTAGNSGVATQFNPGGIFFYGGRGGSPYNAADDTFLVASGGAHTQDTHNPICNISFFAGLQCGGWSGNGGNSSSVARNGGASHNAVGGSGGGNGANSGSANYKGGGGGGGGGAGPLQFQAGGAGGVGGAGSFTGDPGNGTAFAGANGGNGGLGAGGGGGGAGGQGNAFDAAGAGGGNGGLGFLYVFWVK